jgi:hypothetical protein
MKSTGVIFTKHTQLIKVICGLGITKGISIIAINEFYHFKSVSII